MQRMLQLTDDFVGQALADTDRECAGVEAEIDRIPLLDFPVREDDLRGLLESCRDYRYRLQETREDMGEGMAELAAGRIPGGSWWRNGYGNLVSTHQEQEKRLAGNVSAYDREGRRLAGILERRREAESSVRNLDDRLRRLEDNIRALKDGDPGRPEKRQRADRLRHDLTVLQNELLSLPLVDEGLLKHYYVLAERGRGDLDLLSFREPLAKAFRDAALVVAIGPPQSGLDSRSALNAFARECRRQSDRVARRIDELYRKRSRVTPAGTLREMDRSRELADYYDELKGRLEEFRHYLDVLGNSLDFEISDRDSKGGR